MSLKCGSVLVLHKEEWKRLKDQADPTKGKTKDDPGKIARETALLEQSQKWIKSWPDTKRGHVELALEKKSKEKQIKISELRDYLKKRNESIKNNEELLKNARQLIFDTTCYGRELLSALLESKAIEERELQVKLKNEMTQKTMQTEKEKEANNRYLLIDRNYEEVERIKRENNKEIANTNKENAKRQKQVLSENIEKERMLEIQDQEIVKKLNDYDLREKEKCIEFNRKEILKYEEENKKIRKEKEKHDLIDDALHEAYRKHQDIVRCKEKEVYEQLYKKSFNTDLQNQNFNLLKKLQDEQNNKMETFINKGIEKSRILEEEKEKKLLEQEMRSKLNRLKITMENKTAENNQTDLDNTMFSDKSEGLCLRQSLFTAPKEKGLRKYEDRDAPAPDTFTKPSSKLANQLKKRQCEPLSWTGTTDFHKTFAKNAENILKECKNKRPVKKVVENYLKKNNLDAASLPIQDR